MTVRPKSSTCSKTECKKNGITIKLETEIFDVKKLDGLFAVNSSKGIFKAHSLVVACGGPSIPKMGASGFGYKLAQEFGLDIVEPVAALVPLVFTDSLKADLKSLSGISVQAHVRHGKTTFREALLFTHRGLSGPSILQISSYWSPGDMISVNLAPEYAMLSELKLARTNNPKQSPSVFLSKFLPQKLAQFFGKGLPTTTLGRYE